jgi:hypothetical protein
LERGADQERHREHVAQFREIRAVRMIGDPAQAMIVSSFAGSIANEASWSAAPSTSVVAAASRPAGLNRTAGLVRAREPRARRPSCSSGKHLTDLH